MTSDATNGPISDAKRRSLANLKPFKPGQSGNPSGRRAGAKRDRLLAESRAECGPLSAVDDEFLVRAIDKLIEADNPRLSSAERTKSLNTSKRIFDSLRQRKVTATTRADPNALRSYLASKHTEPAA